MKRLFLASLLALPFGSAFAADNLTVTAGSGTTLHYKDVGAGVLEAQVLLSDAAGLSILGTAGSANAGVLTVQGIASMTPLLAAESGTWNITNISGTITLPTGAATAAKQPALGTAGTASADVITIQGIASMTPVGTSIADGSSVTLGAKGDSAATSGTGGSWTVDSLLRGILNAAQGAIVAGTNAGCPNTLAVNQTTSTDLHTMSATGYICSIVLVSASQQGISINEGTGSVCGTGTAYLLGGSGGTTQVAANGGFSATSFMPIIQMKVSADHLCLIQSGAGNVSGFITYSDH